MVSLISQISPIPAKSVTVFGTLQIHQDGLLEWGYSASTFNSTILDLTKVDSLDQLRAEEIVRKNKRAIYAQVHVDNVVWREGYGDPFVFNVEISVPQQQILYHPGFFEVTKFAAIQYICALYVIKWIVFTIHRKLVLLGLLKTRKVLSSQKTI
jgi:transmembrane protein 231